MTLVQCRVAYLFFIDIALILSCEHSYSQTMASIKIPAFALKLLHQVVKVPAVQIAVKNGQFYTKALGGMAGYAIPAGIFAGWMVFPALGDDARGAIGLGPVKEVPVSHAIDIYLLRII